MGSIADETAVVDDQAAYHAGMQLVSLHGVAMAIRTAIDLDVFNILARAGPGAKLCAEEIAAKMPNCVDPAGAAPRLDRVLRFLASHGILRCSFVPETAGRRYGLEPKYRLLQNNQDGLSLEPAFSVSRDKVSLDWSRLPSKLE